MKRRVSPVIPLFFGGFFVIAALVHFFTKPRFLDVQVASRTWTLTVAGFEPWLRHESGWCSSMPYDANLIERSRREKSRTSRGMRIEYADWCVYEIMSSNRAASAKSSGRFGEALVFPTPPVCATCTSYSKESTYEAVLKSADGEQLTCSWYEPAQWAALVEGKPYRVEVSLGHVPSCRTLTPN